MSRRRTTTWPQQAGDFKRGGETKRGRDRERTNRRQNLENNAKAYKPTGVENQHKNNHTKQHRNERNRGGDRTRLWRLLHTNTNGIHGTSLIEKTPTHTKRERHIIPNKNRNTRDEPHTQRLWSTPQLVSRAQPFT